MAAGIVVRGVGDPQAARVLQPTVTGEAVTDGEVVVFGLRCDVKPSVLTDAEQPETRQRGRRDPACVAKSLASRAARGSCQRVAYLRAHQRQKLIQPSGKSGRKEVHLLPGNLGKLPAIHPHQEGACAAHGVRIIRSEEI